MEIYFVRHAETDYDTSKKDVGEYPGPGLTKKGTEQSIDVYEQLKDIKFDRIYCGILNRAKQTIEHYANETGENINYDPRINEISDFFNNYSNENYFMENPISQKSRVDYFVRELKVIRKHKPNSKVLIVSHFNTIEYISKKLKNHIKQPEYASIHSFKI